MHPLWESDQNNRTNYQYVEIEDENVNCIEILQMKIEEHDKILREIERFKRYVQYDDDYDEYDRIEYLFHKIGIPFDIEETIAITNHNVTKFQNIVESDIHIYSEDELWVLQVISL
jgi:glutaredoxin-related protein